ncbi:transmembrane protein 43-like isoform X1 [Babylonia areolata]|uniref:transmembrane protein 43-like isoform X1 n=1 Tax=Babylonia areolata TaxID=304850 RepID=UPI003FD4FF71
MIRHRDLVQGKEYPDDPGMHNPHHNTYTNVTYRQNPSFCERVKQSLVAVVIGLLLIFVASVLLFWNEGRAVQTAKSLDEGLRVLVPLKTVEVAFDNNNGHLVYLQGNLHAESGVYDPFFKLSVQATKLRRTVEMYQWVEHETKREVNEGDRTREERDYSYSLEWRQDLVSSSSFYSSIGHENPSSMPLMSETFTNRKVQVGTFYLSEGLVDQISDFKEIPPSSGIKPGDPWVHYRQGYHYQSFGSPQPGDVRVRLEFAGLLSASPLGPPADVSIVAHQQENHLGKYQTEAGDELEILHVGLITAEDIFAKAHTQNTLLTWAARFGGWLLMFVAFGCLTSIVTTLVDWLPIVRELVAMGVWTLNAALSISLSLTVIALGWIRYRPWLGLSILVMAVTPFFFTRLRSLLSPSSSRHRHV